jgi:hypothetical protein
LAGPKGVFYEGRDVIASLILKFKRLFSRPICVRCKTSKVVNPFTDPFCYKCYADYIDEIVQKAELKASEKRIKEIAEGVRRGLEVK